MSSSSGSCICKKVAFTYSGEPVGKALCHCHQCQKLSGSAFTYNIQVPRESFKWVSGSPKHASFIQESGIKVEYDFCPDCGTVLRKMSEDKEDFKPFYLVQAGTIDGRVVDETPNVEFWVSRKTPWVQPIQGVAQKQRFD